MNDPVVLKGLTIYLKDLEKIRFRYRKLRDTEVAKLEAKFGESISVDELANLYGYGDITKSEYEAALDKIEQNYVARSAAKDLKTPASEALRMIEFDIKNIKEEIATLQRN